MSLLSAIFILWLLGMKAQAAGVSGDPLSDLQRRIDQAPAQATIRLPAGVYQGPIRINKPLTILGEKETIIEGSGNEPVVQIAADDVTLQGLVVRNTEKQAEHNGGGISLAGKRVRLLNNRIEHGFFGIYVKKGGYHELIGNVITGLAELPVSKRGNGIHLEQTDYNRIADNQLLDVQDGIYFDYAHHNTLTGNRIIRSRYGFHLMGADHNRLVGNTVQQSVTGAMVMEATGTRIQDNRFIRQRDTQGYGLFLYSAKDGLIADNVIADNTRGIALDTVQNNLIRGNTISSNAVGVKLFGSVTGTHFTANVFSGNVQQVEWRNEPPEDLWHVNGTGNYWDDYDGMDWNGDRIGDTAYQNKSLLSPRVQKSPAVQLWIASPAYSIVESMVAPSVVRDHYPLMSPPHQAFEPSTQNKRWWPVLTGGILLIFLIIYLIRRKFA